VALPLHAEYGTAPNVFYVPPLSPYRLREDRSIDTESMRLPMEYLESLFGPDVEAALTRLRSEIAGARAGRRSEMLDTLTVFEWKSLFGPFTEEPVSVSPPPAEFTAGGRGR